MDVDYRDYFGNKTNLGSTLSVYLYYIKERTGDCRTNDHNIIRKMKKIPYWFEEKLNSWR